MWMMKVLARKKSLLVRKLEAKAKVARVVFGPRNHFQQDTGRIVLGLGVNPFPQTARKPKTPYARSWKHTRKSNLRSITRRSCGKPSKHTSRRRPAAKKKSQQFGRKSQQSRTGPGPDEAGSDPSSEEESESSSATDDPDGATTLRTWSRLVQQLLRRVLDQSVGRMPLVALELLVCLLLQLVINCENSDRTASERLKKMSRVAPVCEGKSTVCTVSDGEEK